MEPDRWQVTGRSGGSGGVVLDLQTARRLLFSERGDHDINVLKMKENEE